LAVITASASVIPPDGKAAPKPPCRSHELSGPAAPDTALATSCAASPPHAAHPTLLTLLRGLAGFLALSAVWLAATIVFA
jgi:hypothetical protein